MKPYVFCKAGAFGKHSFYLAHDGETHFLFQQNYRQGVDRYYAGGVELNEAVRFSAAHHDSAILRTMEKLPAYIRYVEKEYGFAVLDRTIRNSSKRQRLKAC